jgi:hypothetical protein
MHQSHQHARNDYRIAQGHSEGTHIMKIGLDKTAAKGVLRVGTAVTGITACAAAFGTAGTASAATVPGMHAWHAHLASTPAAVHGKGHGDNWQLEVGMAPRISGVFACEYTSGRRGHSCSFLYSPLNGGWRDVYTAPYAANLFAGHIMLMWSGYYSYSKSINGIPQYTVSAFPGKWNQCTLPSGSGVKNVTAENGLPTC